MWPIKNIFLINIIWYLSTNYNWFDWYLCQLINAGDSHPVEYQLYCGSMVTSNKQQIDSCDIIGHLKCFFFFLSVQYVQNNIIDINLSITIIT